MLNLIFVLTTAFRLIGNTLSHAEEPKQMDSKQAVSTRPQEPKQPYPYDTEEVSFVNDADGVTLAGTLTLPRSQGPFPVVVLLHGSAPFDRDSSLFGHKPFLVWADHLTRQGIAVLRFDKRSVGKSTGNYSTATLENFAGDALAGVAYLKTRKEINTQQIGLIGHSEGGMTAALAATKSKDVSFIVLMAAPCVKWEDLILTQEAAFQRADGVTEEVIEQNRKLRTEVFKVLKEEKNREAAETQLRAVFAKYLVTPAQKKIAEAYYGPMEGQIAFFNSAGFRYNFTFEPVTVLKQITIPVLALNGERDLVVSSEQNLKRIGKTLEASEHTDFTTIELAKLNHAFQTCRTGSMMECGQIEETASPSALKAMSEWILERTAKQK